MQDKLKQFFASLKNQRIMLTIGVLLILAAVVLIFNARPNQNQDTGTPKGAQTGSPAELTLQPAETSAPKPKVQTPAVKPSLLPRGPAPDTNAAPQTNTPPPRPDAHDGLTFEEAMNLFGMFGYRYQFVNCRGTPGNFIMKLGTRFMLDNRDPIEHNIVVATQNFLIPGYDFAIAYAKDLGKYMITCDGGGAASMEVVP
jgi:hypothetical protein